MWLKMSNTTFQQTLFSLTRNSMYSYINITSHKIIMTSFISILLVMIVYCLQDHNNGSSLTLMAHEITLAPDQKDTYYPVEIVQHRRGYNDDIKEFLEHNPGYSFYDSGFDYIGDEEYRNTPNYHHYDQVDKSIYNSYKETNNVPGHSSPILSKTNRYKIVKKSNNQNIISQSQHKNHVENTSNKKGPKTPRPFIDLSEKTLYPYYHGSHSGKMGKFHQRESRENDFMRNFYKISSKFGGMKDKQKTKFNIFG